MVISGEPEISPVLSPEKGEKQSGEA